MKYLTVNEAAKKYGVRSNDVLRRCNTSFICHKQEGDTDSLGIRCIDKDRCEYLIPDIYENLPALFHRRRSILSKRFIKIDSDSFVYGIKMDIMDDTEIVVPYKYFLEQVSCAHGLKLIFRNLNKQDCNFPVFGWITSIATAGPTRPSESILTNGILSFAKYCDKVEVVLDDFSVIKQLTYTFTNKNGKVKIFELINRDWTNPRCLLREYY